MEKKRRNGLTLLAKGQISKAVKRINSMGIRDMKDPLVIQQMEQKYPDRGYPLLERFIQNIRETCLLELERSKTQVFTWESELPASTPAGYSRAGIMIDGQFKPGFMCYGIPVGSPEYVRHELSVKVQEVAREVENIVKVMGGEGQSIWTIARSSTAMKLDYHLSLCYPTK